MSDRVELAVRELVDALRAEMVPPAEPPALVDIGTASRLLGVSRTSVYALMDAGELPSRHVGRRRLIPRAALEAFTNTERTASAVEEPGAVESEVRRGRAAPTN